MNNQRTKTKTTFAIGILSVVMTITSCQHDESGSKGSILIGIWITETCARAVDGNNNPIDMWAQGIYEFTSLGTIISSMKQYSNSSCSGHAEVVVQESEVGGFTFEELGTEVLEEGIDGWRLRVTAPPNTGESFNVEGFYTLSGENLCFSYNISFTPLNHGISEAGLAAIDFENCLARYNGS